MSPTTYLNHDNWYQNPRFIDLAIPKQAYKNCTKQYKDVYIFVHGLQDTTKFFFFIPSLRYNLILIGI